MLTPACLSINPGTGIISGTVTGLAAQYKQPYAVTVSANDGTNVGTASFSWAVTNVAPVVVAHQYSVARGTPLTVWLLEGAWDPGLGTGETLTAVIDRKPRNGQLKWRCCTEISIEGCGLR